MEIKLIASDLDGTIIDRNNYIAPANLEAIKKIHKHNIKFAVCTGKSYSVAKNHCDIFDADFGIFGNGTQVIDLRNKKELIRNTLSKEDLLYIATFTKRFNMHLHLYTDSELITEDLKYLDLRNFKLATLAGSNDLNFKIVKDIADYVATYNPEVFSAVISNESTLKEFFSFFNINENITYTYINKRGKYRDNIIDKEYEYLNISPTHINKDEGLTFLSEYLGIDKKDTMAIGDNINDLEMIQNAGIGVAVGEATDDVKAVATYVTKTGVSEGAFAEAIDQYLD